MAAISPTTFLNAFSWMKMHEFSFIFKFVPKVRINIIPALSSDRRQATIWTKDG